MKRLILVRHAKSDWTEPALRDFDRPLNRRGLRDAPIMAERLVASMANLDQIVSSPALRAKSTALVFAQQFDLNNKQIQFEPAIYEANLSQLLHVINHLHDDWQVVAMFGHNPGFSEMATYLSGRQFELPTCACVVLDFDLPSWKMISAQSGLVVGYDFPKNEK